MKLKRRILSIILVILCVFNSFPTAYAARGDVLTLNDNFYTGSIPDIEYGSTADTYQFDDSVLNGVEDGDDVHLVADAEYVYTDAGSTNVIFTNFELTGDDAQLYTLPDIAEPVVKQVNITKKVIKIKPEKTYIYYGQTYLTDKIESYENQLVEGDVVNITAEFGARYEDSTGKYSICINSYTIDPASEKNYTVELDDTVEFNVEEFTPLENANPQSGNNNYIGLKSDILEAPTGFLISTSNEKDSSLWSSTIKIDLQETENGTVTYYLRCNDPDSEEYQAISNAKTYSYSSAQTKPEIVSIKIEKADTISTLNFMHYGVFTNGNVKITVEAVGGNVPLDTTIYLGEEGEYKSEDATSELRDDNKYHYTAVFEYTCDDVIKDLSLQAYAENGCGKSEIFKKLSGISDVDNTYKTVDSNRLMLVKKDENFNPINIGEYASDKDSVQCNVKISEIAAGIAKIEYGWDLDRTLCDDDKNKLSGHYVGFRENDYKELFVNYKHFNNSNIIKEWNKTLELMYDDSVWAKNNQHTLYMRVTDNAGNVYQHQVQDPVGCDMHAPKITSVEIRKAETSALESVLRFFTFGTFSNDSVEVAIIADDNESIANIFASGVKKITVNGRTAEINDIGEYVLTVSRDDIINAMKITVEDGIGRTTTKAVTEIPDVTGFIKSEHLIVEDDPSEVYWNFSNDGNADNLDKIWYGKDHILETLEIKVAEDKGVVKSGLYSIKITDNGETLFEKTGFSSIELEHSETYTIGNFEDGIHKIEVTVEDNAGNINNPDTASRTFYIDCDPPESGVVTVASPASVTIDGQQWFDKEDDITFRVESSDAASGLKSILVKVNDRSFSFEDDDILLDDNGYYVMVSTADINPDDKHKYTVSGVVTDVAGNTNTIQEFTVYKDFEKPEVNKITVEKKSSAIDKILNVLTFGAYSNDTLILKAYVSDIEFDSGVDYVTVYHDELDAPKRMTDEGNGVFSVEIPVGEQVFASDIIVTVYDKYGKSNVTCPNLESAENGDLSNGKFVMVEKLEPDMTFELPAGDGVTRTDGQTWYKSNKTIEFKAQDEDSGIHNINFTVNGVDITADKNGIGLLKTSVTEFAAERNTAEQTYVFDTDFFTGKIGEPADGRYSISIEITDNAGNVRTCQKEYYIDKKAPNIDKIEFAPLTSDGVKDTSEFIEKLEYGFYFKTDFTVMVYVSDELPSSGLNEVKYRFVPYENGVKQPEITGSQKISDGKATLTVPKGFKGQIFVEAFDNVDNNSGEKTPKAYVVDNAKPDINIIKNVSTSYHDAEGNNLYVVDNSITVEVTDMVSGIKEIGYSQSAEQNPYDRKVIAVNNTGYKVGDSLGDGWTVSAVDENLVTKVTKSFTFSVDDNDVILTFDATDNAINKREDIKSEKFTVDKTSPVINISFREDEDGDVYYNQNRVADITVIDRNFDANLIKVAIENKFGVVPSFSFAENSKTEHTAVIEFDEGDYTFDVGGTDLGNHVATVSFSGGNEKLFFVDKTKPEIEENFASFTNAATENSFNSDKTVNIQVTEHNFAPALVNLRITRKNTGADHSADGLIDVTAEVLGNTGWISSGDIHTISFTVSMDAVYQVEITPSDLADNNADHRSTAVFEIDKTVPIVKAKNGTMVSDNNTEYLDIYTYSRKDEPAPTVEFDDLNIDHINYVLTVYIPDYTSSEAATVIRPVRVYLEEDENKSGKITGNKFVLPDFAEDGVYALELTAVDVAGNESLVNVNTYARMVDQDVLAYIMESNLENKTGLYSFQYENGEAISKRPDNFSDIKIFVLAKKDTDVDIVLRDNNGNEYNTNAPATTDNSIYGMNIYNFTLEAGFFKDNFQDDTDNELYLTVKNDGGRIDLGKMHIDNIAPDCDLPEEFWSWKWYYGEEDRTITISNISELIDESQSRVYDNGKEIEFKYSAEDDTIEFTLEKGWHNVGIILSDMAGNTYNIQEKSNIHIGFFWLWVIIGVSVTLTGTVVYTFIRSKKRKQLEEE